MDTLNQNNDIEIKLLANRRFIYSNHKRNIVITAEHLATKISVLYPDEYENYSKRVDFVNSKGKTWTIGLYIPEHKNYKENFNKTLFCFALLCQVKLQLRVNCVQAG